MSEPLIDVVKALRVGTDARWVDCRFSLADPSLGAKEHAEAHIPGAVHADLDRDLSDLTLGAGRHPLPAESALVSTFRRLGIRNDQRVIAYDAGNGLFASRLWWLLRVFGHRQVQVLNGGLSAWSAEGGELSGESVEVVEADFSGAFDDSMVVDVEAVAARLAAGAGILVDARSPDRFRGEVEPIDALAGHVPGAKNFPLEDNQRDAKFLPASTLRDRWLAFLGKTKPSEVVHMCGSGVTACANRLAMDHAGLNGSKVYVGSWSDWISDGSRPVATSES